MSATRSDQAARLEQELGGLIGTGEQRTALCPIHRGAEPSVAVDLATCTWRCAVCEVSGIGADELQQAVLEGKIHAH